MTPTDWLRAIAIWSPLPELSWGPRAFSLEEHVRAIGDLLAARFPPEVFCEATVKLMVSRCETFPNYYWCCRLLEPRP